MAKSFIRTARETWLFWILFLLYGFALGRIYRGGSPSWQFSFVFNLAFALCVVIWLVADARRQRRALSFDFPALTFFFWPVFAPIYLFQTRGLRAFLSLFGFAIAYYLSSVIGVLFGRMTL